MKKLILITLLIVGCATKSATSTQVTNYEIGMTLDEFKNMNKELTLIEEKDNDFVYARKECSKCKDQYYIFINGKLKASLPFWGGFDNFQLNN
tara:strand:- start:197 stop:475 length:279 start_codon:yes stop_codon:yes gene_type:complete